jgi:hypothetical protein
MVGESRQVRKVLSLTGLVALCFLAASCSKSNGDPPKGGGVDMANTMMITSSAFGAGQVIPRQYTGEGDDISPSLAWSGLPAATKELAVIMDDPDAPRPEPWVHWVIYKIPVTAAGLPERVPAGERVGHPAGALQGKNSGGTFGYHGPLPPNGHGVHHYHFKLYALDAALDLQSGLDKPGLLAAMKGHILGQAELVGTYERK